MTKRVSTSVLLLTLALSVAPVHAATRADCVRAAKEAVSACVQGCNANSVKRFRNRCRSLCRSARYRNSYIRSCLTFVVPTAR